MEQDTKGSQKTEHQYHFKVNKQVLPWPKQHINGREIKEQAGSPANYVVNQVVPGPGGDPEIGDAQEVNLDESAEPKGIKTFITRTSTTSPGA